MIHVLGTREKERKKDVCKLRDTVFVTNNQVNFSFLLVSIIKRQLIEAPISPPTTYPYSLCRLFPCYCHKRKRAPEWERPDTRECYVTRQQWSGFSFFFLLFSREREKKRIFSIYSFCFLLNLSSLYKYIYIYISLEGEHIK